MTQEPFDVTIVGAGVVGLAVAETLAMKKRQVVILEKNQAFGQETSSRNSEVIHAGIYYQKDFLKSRLCVSGNRLLYAWCEQHQVPHRRIGKLIVATSDEECGDLERIKILAEGNGVEDLTLLGKGQTRTMEPAVTAEAALFSPATGIIDTHGLMRSLLWSAEEKGAVVACRSKVTAVDFNGDVYDLAINGGEYRIRSKTLINCAGLYADHIAALAGLDIDARGYRQKPCKGNYFTASPAPKLRHLVYPVPVRNNEGLGIHATLDLSGRVRFGPDSRYLIVAGGGAGQKDPVPDFDFTVDEGRKDAFYESIRKYLPAIHREDLHPDMSGIRPKIQGPGDPPMDFIIREESAAGFPGLVNLIGIESPGLTSCLAIAEHIKKLLGDI